MMFDIGQKVICIDDRNTNLANFKELIKGNTYLNMSLLNYLNDEAMLWYGWMLERSRDIQKIIDELERAGVKGNDKIYYRRVLALDLEHGLSPFRNKNY